MLARCADPAATAADSRIPAASSSIGAEEPLWTPLSLACGHPGMAVVFSGCGRPREAHRYLAEALAALRGRPDELGGSFLGPGAAAFALLVAHRATGGYRGALERLDAHQRQVARVALPPLTDAPLASNGAFEAVRGLAGLGRYLLARVESCEEELRLVLGRLVALSRGAVDHPGGNRVPRWWSMAAPKRGQEAEMPDGHLNFGLSHGVAGPLALLSLAWREGVAVEGQREAIESLMALLRRWAHAEENDESGAVRWPHAVTLGQWAAGPARMRPHLRPSWCYGVPGMSRAVQLAALALGRPDWHELAHRSLLPLLTTPVAAWHCDDPGLCHGWGGLLHLFLRLGEHVADPRLPAVREELAARTLAQFDPAYRFGFRSTLTATPQGSDMPGFLQGAGGTALALRAYADGTTCGDWDMPLLLS
ncbi:lanthionine synthetase C family protein [Streptomyces hoynatensis]|uniref:lanthionine synthetase C family protein n=1 Tax=Streptomyces hoynatensis TaxID=1141874 RepID=UPI001F4DCC94|nr:lanthionine synthetase C family protein [Streptomyces hoynatensis]